MSTKVITRSSSRWPGAGQWSPRTVDGKRSAAVGCPDCGDVATLGDHTVGADGVVSPSLMCNACSYHEVGVVLEGWNAS